MTAGLPLAGHLANPRVLAALVLMIGLVCSQAGRGTMAYFTAADTGASNVFVAGKIAFTQTLSSASSSTIQFGSSGTSDGTNNASCALDTTTGSGNNFINTQHFVPGTYCVGKLVVANTGNNDAWMRIRLHLTARGGTSASQELLDRMKFYFWEVDTSTNANDCTAAGVTTAVLTTPATGPNAGFSQVTQGTNGVIVDTIGGSASATAWGLTTAAALSGTDISSAVTANSYMNLIGNDAVNAIYTTGATGALLPKAGTRYFCAAFHWPDAGTPGSNSTGDNSAFDGTATFQFHVALAQKSGRGV